MNVPSVPFPGLCKKHFKAVFRDNRANAYLPVVVCGFVDTENIVTWLGGFPLKQEEGQNQYEGSVQCCEGVLEFEPGALSLERNLFAFFCWMSNTSLGVSFEQRLSVWYCRWIDRVGDWNPERAAYNDERKWWPERVGEESDGCVLKSDLQKASVGR